MQSPPVSIQTRPAGAPAAAAFVHTARVYNTHEHMMNEEAFLKEKPDVLRTLFHHYMLGDLCVAGASRKSVETLMDASNPDVAGRLRAVPPGRR